MAGMVASGFLVNVASAHPGHASGDLAAQVSQPWAGPDHFVAFVSLAALLLAALHISVRIRCAKMEKVRR